jgi:hypothetical protein
MILPCRPWGIFEHVREEFSLPVLFLHFPDGLLCHADVVTTRSEYLSRFRESVCLCAGPFLRQLLLSFPVEYQTVLFRPYHPPAQHTTGVEFLQRPIHYTVELSGFRNDLGGLQLPPSSYGSVLVDHLLKQTCLSDENKEKSD